MSATHRFKIDYDPTYSSLNYRVHLANQRWWGTDWRFLSSFASEQEARDFIAKHIAEMNKFPVFL